MTRHFVRSPDDTEAHWGEVGCPLRDPNAACAFALPRTGLQPQLARVGRLPLPKVLEDVPYRPDLGFTGLNRRHFHPWIEMAWLFYRETVTNNSFFQTLLAPNELSLRLRLAGAPFLNQKWVPAPETRSRCHHS